jgi:mRNA-decapping enzyme subunit 2
MDSDASDTFLSIDRSTPLLKVVLDDISSRFIVNLPKEELDAPERLCFQVELAFWFYEDHFQEAFPDSLPCLSMKLFFAYLFRHVPFLHTYLGQLDQILTDFMHYKTRVPVCGIALLNSTRSKVQK